jgi:hypothetical protein
MANGISAPGVVLVPVRRDLDDGGDRRDVCLGGKPQVRRQPGAVGERDPEIVDLANGGIVRRRYAKGHTWRIGHLADS